VAGNLKKICMFEILIIVTFLGVLSAIKMVISERKRRKKANQELKIFEEEHPSQSKQSNC
jgi:hypothetical protein